MTMTVSPATAEALDKIAEAGGDVDEAIARIKARRTSDRAHYAVQHLAKHQIALADLDLFDRETLLANIEPDAPLRWLFDHVNHIVATY